MLVCLSKWLASQSKQDMFIPCIGSRPNHNPKRTRKSKMAQSILKQVLTCFFQSCNFEREFNLVWNSLICVKISSVKQIFILLGNALSSQSYKLDSRALVSLIKINQWKDITHENIQSKEKSYHAKCPVFRRPYKT